MQSCSCCIYESEDADKSYTLLKLSLYESYYYISEQEMNPVLVLKVHVHSHSSQYVMCLTKLWPFVRVIGMINGFLRFDAFHLSSDIFWWTSLKVLLFLLQPLISPQFWYLFHLGIGRAEKHFRGPRHSWHFCESHYFRLCDFSARNQKLLFLDVRQTLLFMSGGLGEKSVDRGYLGTKMATPLESDTIGQGTKKY